MNNPLVSIICVCKNRKEYIRQCVESVLSQNYENFEFLIQDGASTDGTVEIIQEYRDDRIKLVSEPDSGPGEALVRALHRIRGSIWGSCLSDEAMRPHAVTTACTAAATAGSLATSQASPRCLPPNSCARACTAAACTSSSATR